MKKLIIVLAILLFAGQGWAGEYEWSTDGGKTWTDSVWTTSHLPLMVRDKSQAKKVDTILEDLGWGYRQDSRETWCGEIIRNDDGTSHVVNAKPCPWQITKFDLLKDFYGDMPYPRLTNRKGEWPTAQTKIDKLNELLRNGWHLQNSYKGEDEVWLQRRVCP